MCEWVESSQLRCILRCALRGHIAYRRVLARALGGALRAAAHQDARRDACEKPADRAHDSGDASEEAILLAAKENENVLRSISDQTIRKEILVPGRLVNLVVSG